MANETTAPITTNEVRQSRVDFETRDFKQLVRQKGLRMTHEKAVRCACSISMNGNALPECVNCAGLGWQFKDAETIYGVIQSVLQNQKIAEAFKMDVGTAMLTTNDSEKLAWHDRLTLIDGESIYSEVAYVKEFSSVWFDFLTYPPETIEYAYLYNAVDTAHTDVTNNITVTGRKIVLDVSGLGLTGNVEYNIAVRYTHKPRYYVMDIQKDIRNTRKVQSGGIEALENLPVNGIIKKVHYWQD